MDGMAKLDINDRTRGNWAPTNKTQQEGVMRKPCYKGCSPFSAFRDEVAVFVATFEISPTVWNVNCSQIMNINY